MARLFGLRNVLTRNRQYFNHYRINVLLLLMIIVVNIFLTVLIIKKLMYDSSPSYIATSPSGDVLWRCPLDNRYSENWQKRYCNSQLTDDEVKNFAREAVEKVWSLDFLNFRSELADASRYFSQKGWSLFSKALQESGKLKMVKGNRNILGLILTPSIRSVKILVNKRGVKQVGINSSTKRYNWWVSMQLNIPQLDGGSANVLVRVQREPVENYPERLSITQYVSGRKS